MQNTITALEAILAQYAPLLQQVPETAMAAKPRPEKWSKKEILGHLADSAQNNIRRFIVAQYEEMPAITYRQDDWVAISHYKSYVTADLINLWLLLNRHILVILKNTSAEIQQRKCMTTEPHTIAWLAADYNRHLLHHLHQVLDLEPVSY
jgi:hypothetical protein